MTVEQTQVGDCGEGSGEGTKDEEPDGETCGGLDPGGDNNNNNNNFIILFS